MNSSRLESCVEAQERFKGRKPKAPEGGSDVTIRESPEELTLRVEEVNTWKALIVSNTLSRKDGALPWLTRTGMPSARRCTRAILAQDTS